MYREFYGFTGQLFEQVADSESYFESRSHRRALSCLNDGLAQGEGFVVLTGAAGSGKSMTVGQLTATIDRDRVTVAQIGGSRIAGDHSNDCHLAEAYLQRGQTAPAIARAFGVATHPISGLDPVTSHPFMLDANLCFLRDEVRAGRRCLLVVEDAQSLPVPALEALRLMSLFQLGDHPLLQILLVGRPELAARLQSYPDLAQLRQRIVATHQLDSLDADEVEPYIRHHLARVGWHGNPGFAPQIHPELHTATGGMPGGINRLVDRLLRLGTARQSGYIDAAMLAQSRAEPSSNRANERETSPFAAQALKIRLEAALAVCEQQIAELQKTVVELGNANDRTAHVVHHRRQDDTLQERLGSLESRVIEQERTIRHTLTMLIEWIERDGVHGLAA